MWIEFFEAAAVATLFLLVPGYLLLRALRLPRAWSACLAPAASFGVMAVLGVVYGKARIPANVVSEVAVPSALFVAAALLARHGLRKGAPDRDLPCLSWGCVALYVVLGLVVAAFMYLKPLPGPNQIMVGKDVAHHLNGVLAFAQSGDFSSVGMSLYQTTADLAINPIGSGFYPAGWYIPCAMLVQLGVCETAVAMNAVNLVVVAVVWPLGVLALLRWIMPSSRRITVLGAIACTMFMPYPWYLLEFGPIFPTLAGFSLIPSCAVAFMLLVESDLSRRDRVRALIAFLACAAGVALTQTSALFVDVIILVPYVCSRILTTSAEVRIRRLRIGPHALVVAWLAFCALVWVAVNRSSIMASVVRFSMWNYDSSLWQSIVNIFFLAYEGRFVGDLGQPVLGLVVFLGIVWTLRNRRLLWVSASYALACLTIVGNGLLKGTAREIVAGFWYSDPPRLAALAAICAVPLAAVGFAWLMHGLARAFRAEGRWGSSVPTTVAPVALASAVTIAVFFPSFNMPTPDAPSAGTGRVETKVESTRSALRAVYSDYETINTRKRAFLRTSQSRIEHEEGQDALVMNNPFDGSFIAYGDAGMRVLFRDLATGEGSQAADAAILRERLDQVATDHEVQDAVRRLGVRYVIKLEDCKENPLNSFKWSYKEDQWAGINGITDDTPGFEVVQRQGDMVLYRITAA